MTLGELSRMIVAMLCHSPAYNRQRATAVKDIVLEDFIGLTKEKLALNPSRKLLPETIDNVNAIIKKITDGMPVQYAVGQAKFMGMDLKVNPSVLIPRQETAGLVDIICDDMRDKSDLRVFDICTGSGCIAIALSRNLLFPVITASDNSRAALDVAKDNASSLHASISFVLEDALTMVPQPETYDLIVSNPPYITLSETPEVAPDVLEYEPHEALFVPDNKPTEFYIAIAGFAFKSLKSGGHLYFEINPHFASLTADKCREAGFRNVDLIRDYTGVYRYIRAIKNTQSF